MSEPIILNIDLRQQEILTISFIWFGINWAVDVPRESLSEVSLEGLVTDSLRLFFSDLGVEVKS